MAVGDDGQRYMVVEVINMEEDENSELQLQDKDDHMEIAELYLEDEVDPLESKKDQEQDMTTCFGFVVRWFRFIVFFFKKNTQQKSPYILHSIILYLTGR